MMNVYDETIYGLGLVWRSKLTTEIRLKKQPRWLLFHHESL